MQSGNGPIDNAIQMNARILYNSFQKAQMWIWQWILSYANLDYQA